MSVDVVSKLREIVKDISAATVNASSRHSSQYSVDVAESRSCEYDNVMSLTTTTPQKPADISNADVSIANGRFITNTNVTLSQAALPPTVPAPPRTRTTMREMQASDNYVSLLPSKDEVPIRPSATAIRQRPPTPPEDVEKEWKRIVCAAETVIDCSSNQSVDEFSNTSSFERLSTCLDSDADHSLTVVSTDGNNTKSLQPLSFANPLYLYKTSTRGASTGGSTSSLDGNIKQKSYSLSSFTQSNEIGSLLPTGGGCRTPDNSNSLGSSILTRHEVGTGLSGWKPPQSNECLQEMRSAAGPRSEPVSVSNSCAAKQSKQRSSEATTATAASNVMVLDTPPDTPCSAVSSCTSRKPASSSNNVRMGVRSVQRRPMETEKSKTEARHFLYIVL